MTGNCRDHNDRENDDCQVPQTGHFYPRQSYTPLFLSPSLFSLCLFLYYFCPYTTGGGDRGVNQYLWSWRPINISLWHWSQNSIYEPVLSLGICCRCGVLERAELTRGNRSAFFSVVERWGKQFSLHFQMSVNSFNAKMYKYMLKEKIYETSNMRSWKRLLVKWGIHKYVFVACIQQLYWAQ